MEFGFYNINSKKKGDLSDCNNYRGISLINVGLKIISKIVTNRIAKYTLEHKFVRPEQFGFRNKEECISLYISIREIYQRRKFQGSFTYLAFLDLKKAYDSVLIFNILTKLYNLGIINRGLYWSYGFKSRNSSVSLYDITRELRIPPLSAVCLA